MVWFPIPVRIWVLSNFLDVKACRTQLQGYTFSQRYRWPRPLAAAFSWALSGPIVSLLHSAGAIPVHRGSVTTLRTLRASVEALARGESIILYPDIEYTSGDAQVGSIYKGFLFIDRLYYQRTGAHIPFVPVGYNVAQAQIRLGSPIQFQDGDFTAQLPDIAAQLRDSINDLNSEFPKTSITP
jgi:1-acyl-sn-glycerol-3-phosphate acyltransferase